MSSDGDGLFTGLVEIDNKRFAVSYETGIKIFDSNTMMQLRVIAYERKHLVISMCPIPLQNKLLCVFSDLICVWDLGTGQRLVGLYARFVKDDIKFGTIAVYCESLDCVVVQSNRKIIAIDMKSQKIVFEHVDGSVASELTLLPNGNIIIRYKTDPVIHVWALCVINGEFKMSIIREVKLAHEPVCMTVMDINTVVLGFEKGIIAFADLEENKVVYHELHDTTSICFLWRIDSRLFVCVNERYESVIWDARKKLPLLTSRQYDKKASFLTLLSNGNVAFVGNSTSNGKYIGIFDINNAIADANNSDEYRRGWVKIENSDILQRVEKEREEKKRLKKEKEMKRKEMELQEKRKENELELQEKKVLEDKIKQWKLANDQNKKIKLANGQ